MLPATLQQGDIHESLREVGIVYHEPYGLFACLDCVKTLYGTHLLPHLRKEHQHDKGSIAVVERNVARLTGLVKSHLQKDKPWPTTVIPALEGIVVEQGYHCQFCNAAYHTDNAMKTHLRKKHKDHEQRQWWRRKLPMGPMQSFSIGNRASGTVWKSPSFQVSIEASEIKPCSPDCAAAMLALSQQVREAVDKPKEREKRYQDWTSVSKNDSKHCECVADQDGMVQVPAAGISSRAASSSTSSIWRYQEQGGLREGLDEGRASHTLQSTITNGSFNGRNRMTLSNPKSQGNQAPTAATNPHERPVLRPISTFSGFPVPSNPRQQHSSEGPTPKPTPKPSGQETSRFAHRAC
jgi:hypothetical protein